MSAQHRYGELDALRGIAAFVVVLFHCWMTVPWPGVSLLHATPADSTALAHADLWFRITPLRVVTAGPASVGLFFILSGLVLALPWVRGQPPAYGEFLIKRFFRLYLPFAAAIGLAALLCLGAGAGPVPGLSPWFNHSWNEPLTADLVAGHLLMLGTQAGMSLDNVMWSLVHEARISMVFPFLVVVTLARPAHLVAASVAIFAVVSAPGVFGWLSGQLAGPGDLWIPATLLDSLRYLIYFVAGILLASRLGRITRWVEAMAPLPRAGLWLAAGALLLVRFGPYSDGAWAAGAALLIALSLGSPAARRWLALRPLRWLGRVSYSLYLVHVPILLAVVHLGHDRLALGWLLAMVCVLALVGAEVFYRLVESPSQRLGQRMARRAASRRWSPAAQNLQ